MVAIAVPEKVHRQDCSTYGGRSRLQVEANLHNLRAAIDKDFDQTKPVLMQKYGAEEAKPQEKRCAGLILNRGYTNDDEY